MEMIITNYKKILIIIGVYALLVMMAFNISDHMRALDKKMQQQESVEVVK